VVSAKDASWNWNPVWSPDGKQILFRSKMVNATIDVDKDWVKLTPKILPKTEDGRHFVAWVWSPDGAKLVGTFSGNQLGIGYFSLIDRRFEKLADTETYPMWLSDSRRFVFSTENKVHVADIVTKRVREVFDTGEEEIGSIGISSDDRLLYFSVQETESDIWLLDLSR
jgi:Tol biopolymer transport system component